MSYCRKGRHGQEDSAHAWIFPMTYTFYEVNGMELVGGGWGHIDW